MGPTRLNTFIFHLAALLITTNLLLTTLASAEKFSIAIIPDTQWYIETNPELFEAQTQWIADNRVRENIIYAAHLGDLKDDTNCDVKVIRGRTEWQIVNDALRTLENPVTTGLADGIPYGVVPGNHDFDQIGTRCPDWDTERPLSRFNSLLGASRFNNRSYYGGTFQTDNNEGSNYTLFEASGIKFIAINLTFRETIPATTGTDDPTPELTEANSLLEANRDRLAIVTSHYFLEEHSRGQATDNGPYGARTYDLLSGNPNLFLMLSAHKRGEAWRTETRPGMNDVHLLLSNYQDIIYDPPNEINYRSLRTNRISGGNTGLMRIMRFDTDTNLVSVETFAPPIPLLSRPSLTSNNFVTDGVMMSDNTASNFDFQLPASTSPPKPPSSLRINLSSLLSRPTHK